MTAPPPYPQEAEDHVVGASLTSDRARDTILEHLPTEHIYQPRHQRILKAALHLHEQDHPVDLATLAEHLDPKDMAAARDLYSATYAAGNVHHHAAIVNDHHTRRQLINIGQQIARAGWEPHAPIPDMLGEAEQLVYQLTTQTETGELRPIRDTLQETFRQLNRPGGEITGTPTGIVELDRLTAGLQPGNLVVVAGRPGMGKSALAIQTAHHITVTQQDPRPVALFTLEMSDQEINQRLLSLDSRVPLMRIRTRIGLTDTDRAALNISGGRLHNSPLHIDDTVNAKVTDVRARTRRLRTKHPDLALVIVDYLQLMISHDKAENRNLELAHISRGLKLLARELDVPVIATAQLNRMVENRADKQPMLSDLRDSGAIEQDADLVVFIHRPPDQEGVAQLTLAKHRNGPTGPVRVAWTKERATFSNLHQEGVAA